jgi:UDP-N-acetyl-D-mannosaminuronate dehydrogenase
MEALNDVGKTIRGSRLAILGVAYKPDVKDAQLSPVERIVKRLAGMGAEIALYDPYFAGEVVYGTRVANDVEEAVAQADCIVFGTAHKEFRSLDPDRLAALTARPSALVDSRNVLEPSRVKKAGFKYLGVGRAK